MSLINVDNLYISIDSITKKENTFVNTDFIIKMDKNYVQTKDFYGNYMEKCIYKIYLSNDSVINVSEEDAMKLVKNNS